MLSIDDFYLTAEGQVIVQGLPCIGLLYLHFLVADANFHEFQAKLREANPGNALLEVAKTMFFKQTVK